MRGTDYRLWQFRDTGRLEAPQVTARLTLNNGEARRDMALAGLGLAMLPDFIVAPALREGRLLQVLAAHETRVLPIHAVWPPISPIPVKLRALIWHLAGRWPAGGRGTRRSATGPRRSRDPGRTAQAPAPAGTLFHRAAKALAGQGGCAIQNTIKPLIPWVSTVLLRRDRRPVVQRTDRRWISGSKGCGCW